MHHNLNSRQLAIALMALRYWQQNKAPEIPDLVPEPEENDGEEWTPVGLEEIDNLCEGLNTVERASEDIIITAKSMYGSDDVEIDDDAATSKSDVGVWVQAWVYLTNEEAGIEEPANEEAED